MTESEKVRAPRGERWGLIALVAVWIALIAYFGILWATGDLHRF